MVVGPIDGDAVVMQSRPQFLELATINISSNGTHLVDKPDNVLL